jgi:hypothetical protein
MAYTGNSVVDYLKSSGQASDMGSRSALYSSAGLNLGSYSGSAAQNTALLGWLQSGSGAAPASAPVAPAAPSAPAPASVPTKTTITPDTGARTAYADQLNKDVVKLDSAKSAESAAALKAMQDYFANLPTSTQVYGDLREQNNLPQQEELVNALTKQSMSLTDLVEAVPGSVNERTGDFLVNESDRTAIVAREQQPLLESLTKLLRQKQYEEVGLAGKQNLVKELLTLTMQDQERGAKPLQLGYDYSVRDREIAVDLLQGLNQTKFQAYDADLSSEEKKQQDAADKEFQKLMESIQQNNRVQLENLSSKNSLSNSLTLKAASDKKEAADTKTETAWNSLLGSAKTEYDVFTKLDKEQDKLRAQGIDVDKLWQKHSALAGEVGVGGEIRKSSTSLFDDPAAFAATIAGVQAQMQAANKK